MCNHAQFNQKICSYLKQTNTKNFFAFKKNNAKTKTVIYFEASRKIENGLQRQV